MDGLEDACTKDGTVDYHGKPALKRKTGGWNSAILLLVSEGVAALAFTGVEVNMVLFSKTVLKQSNEDAANNFTRWMGTLNICTLLGAFLSDSYLGRYLTCVVFQAVLLIVSKNMETSFSIYVNLIRLFYRQALVILSISTQEILLEPEGCGRIGKACNDPSGIGVAIFYISIYLLALGSGSIEPALATLGAEQFDEEDPEEKISKSKFFSYFYVALNMGSLIAETVLVYVENLGKWVLAFWISSTCALLGLVFLLSGTCRYRHYRPLGNPLARLFQVIVASVRKLKLASPSQGDMLYEVQGMDAKDDNWRIYHTEDFRFLDRAAVLTPSDMLMFPDKTQKPNPWRLCTVTQVEEVKCIIRLLPIWFCTILASIVFVQVLSLFVEQGAAMNTKIGNFHIPPASMTAFDIISTSTFIICYETIIVPLYAKITKTKPNLPDELQKIGIGLAVSIIGMSTAGLVEQHRLQYATAEAARETTTMSIFWQTPQYVLVGIAEAFIYVAQWEFFASQIPDSLKSLGLGLSMSSSALGSYLCSALLTVVMKITSSHGMPGWIAPNLNDGHMDKFFFLTAALTTFDLVLFIMCAKWYKRTKTKKWNRRTEASEIL